MVLFTDFSRQLHTAKLYPASCQVTVKRIMSLFARHVQNSSSWLTACGPVSSLWPCHTQLWSKPTLRNLCVKLLPKRDGRLPKEELLPPWAVFQHISAAAITLLSMSVSVLLYAVILLSCICLPINSFYVYNAFFTNLRALCRATLDTWQDRPYQLCSRHPTKNHDGHNYSTAHVWKVRSAPPSQRTGIAMFIVVTIKHIQNYWSNIQGRSWGVTRLDAVTFPPKWPLSSSPPTRGNKNS